MMRVCLAITDSSRARVGSCCQKLLCHYQRSQQQHLLCMQPGIENAAGPPKQGAIRPKEPYARALSVDGLDGCTPACCQHHSRCQLQEGANTLLAHLWPLSTVCVPPCSREPSPCIPSRKRQATCGSMHARTQEWINILASTPNATDVST